MFIEEDYRMKQAINIQDHFLNSLRRENVYVTVYLLNGFQLKGLVKGFDNFTVILESDGKQQLIYKHAISTFTPQRPINLSTENNTNNNNK
jgi:host factor-I protein